MKATVSLVSLGIDPYGQIPAHVQIQQQIKFACSNREVGPGDELPSIRRLAEQLGVGAGVVRRAYRELCAAGVLANGRRRHVVLALGAKTAEVDVLVRGCRQECDRLVAWGRDNGLSAVVLGRLVLRHALLEEAKSPSYLFVDVCRLAALRSADTVANAWGIGVGGRSLLECADFLGTGARGPSAVLVNESLHEAMTAGAGDIGARIFPVIMRVPEGLQRRIRKLPAHSRVLLLMADDHFPRVGRAVLHRYRQLFGRRWRFAAKPAGSIRDLGALVDSGRYGLCLLTPSVWERTPHGVKRRAQVVRMVEDPDPHSLEAIRLAAGVLM